MKAGRADSLDEFPTQSPFFLSPSCFPRVPLAVPYWNSATGRAILRSLLSARVIHGSALAGLRSSIQEFLGVGDVMLCGSGSLALEIALRVCGVKRGDEVVVPTFCCAAVVPPILALGAVPVLADAGAELNITARAVEAALTKKTGAIIVPHLFGNPADIGAIIDLARSGKIRVIDDAAQALGATIDGRSVGAFGDAGVLSFGSEKICSGLGGGVAVCRSREIYDRAAAPSLPPAQLPASLRALASTLFCRRWRRWTLPLFSRLKKRADPDATPEPYRVETMPNLGAAVALTLMRTLRDNIAARRARVAAYRELLGGEARLKLVPHRPGSACLAQVVRVLPKRRDVDSASEIVRILAAAGYEIQGSYVPIHLLAGYRRLARGPLPHAENVWCDLIELPCEPDVSLAHIERIAMIVKRALMS